MKFFSLIGHRHLTQLKKKKASGLKRNKKNQNIDDALFLQKKYFMLKYASFNHLFEEFLMKRMTKQLLTFSIILLPTIIHSSDINIKKLNQDKWTKKQASKNKYLKNNGLVLKQRNALRYFSHHAANNNNNKTSKKSSQ